MFQKAAIPDFPNIRAVALRISIASVSLRFKSSNLKHYDRIFFSWNLVGRGKMNAQRITYNLVTLKIQRNSKMTLQCFNGKNFAWNMEHGTNFAWVKQTQQSHGKAKEKRKFCVSAFFSRKIWKYSTLILIT